MRGRVVKNMRAEAIESLLRRSLQGDRPALDELVDRLRPDVERHVHRLLSRYRSFQVRCEPADVIHAVWEDFLVNFHKFRTGDFELWFARRRRNRVLDFIRKDLRAAENLARFARSNPHQAGPFSEGEDRVLGRDLLEKIDQLPPRQKAVVILYHGKGWTFREIGGLLAVQTTSVGTLHARALKRLRKLLDGRLPEESRPSGLETEDERI